MAMVHHAPTRVNSNRLAPRVVEADDFDVVIATLDDQFVPSEADHAYWTAFCAARDGEPGRLPLNGQIRMSPAACLRFCRGTSDGTRARDIALARELGKHLGQTSEISEPPGGMRPHEAEAYREGFAEGQEILAEEELLDDLWGGAIDDPTGSGITDIDIWYSGRFA